MSAAFEDLRAELVREICERGAVRSSAIAEAFAAVPRHLFLPELTPAEVYTDRSIPVKLRDGVPISSSSQPAMMAEMLEQLALREGERVLEIGAGSGYNAALLATLVGPSGFVATVELDEDLAHAARRHLDDAGFTRVRVIHGDGTAGDAADTPFDALIATVAIGDVPPAWTAQVRTGGRVVLPLALRTMQKIVCFERTPASLTSTSILDGGFMMLRGTTASVVSAPIALDAATTVRAPEPQAIDARAIVRALAQPAFDILPVTPLTIDEVWLSFGFWLALHEPGFCRITVTGTEARTTRVPDISGTPRTLAYAESTTFGSVAQDGVAVFAVREDGCIVLRTFGRAANAAERVQTALAAWHAAGRPHNDDLRIDVTARDAGFTAVAPRPVADAVTVELPSARALVRWLRR